MKRAIVTVALLGLFSFLTLGLLGCGNSSSSQPIGVTLSPASTPGLDQAQTLAIAATVTNDSKNAGVTWSVSGGGAFSGTPTTTSATYQAPASVTSSFTATVTATSVTDTTKTASLQIKVNPLPTVTSNSLPAATAGAAYSQTLSESGGTSPYTWTITAGGSLPPGLSLNSITGVISGTPTGGSGGPYTFQVSDATKVIASSQPIAITVNAAPKLNVTTASLPQGMTGTAYSQTLQATGGVTPYQWSYTGTLPAGLSLSSEGVISGTPTAPGTFNFTAIVTDSGTPAPQTASANLSITITVGPLVVTTTSSSLSQGAVNEVYAGATLQASGGVSPYTWAGTPPPGLTLSSAGVISGTPTTAGATPFTVTVTDSETPAKNATASLTITINAALTITTKSLPGGTVGTAYSATVSATGGLTPYSWSLTGEPSWLSIDQATGALSGTPTTAGTTPSFTVTVTDKESATAHASLAITVSTACSNNKVLSGQYAMLVRGWKSATDVAGVVGSFVADGNGNISSGSLDVNDQSNGPQSGTFNGTYCAASDNLATVNLTYGGGLSGSATFAAALDASDGNGRIISYDSSSLKASGVLRKQDTAEQPFTTSMISGNYAFGFSGAEGASSGTPPRFAMAGQFNANNGSLIGSYDSDIHGTGITTDQTLLSVNLNVVSSTTGRGTVAITFNGSNAQHGTLNFVFYVVSATELLVMEDDAAGSSLLTGQVVQQSGTFTDASLSGVGVIGLEGLSSGTTPATTVGFFTANGGGSLGITVDQNLGGTISSPSYPGSSYLTASNGRVTLTVNGQSNPPVLYMVGQNEAFMVGTGSAVDFGFMWPQSGSSFTNASLSGTYLGGSRQPVSASVDEEVESIAADGNGNITGTSDTNGSGGPSTSSITQTYAAASSGRVVVSQNGSESEILYIISGTQAVAMPTQDTEPKLVDFHQ